MILTKNYSAQRKKSLNVVHPGHIKSHRPDGISAVMLKATTESITKGITTLFNKSIESGEVPKDWKVSTVVPIPKGDDSSKPSNYRPISLIYSQQTSGEAYA